MVCVQRKTKLSLFHPLGEMLRQERVRDVSQEIFDTITTEVRGRVWRTMRMELRDDRVHQALILTRNQVYTVSTKEESNG